MASLKRDLADAIRRSISFSLTAIPSNLNLSLLDPNFAFTQSPLIVAQIMVKTSEEARFFEVRLREIKAGKGSHGR